MMTTKQHVTLNHLWWSLLGYFSIALLFPNLAFSEHFLFVDLKVNQIPIALSDNGAILIEDRNDPDNITRYIRANGVKIRAPEGATIEGLNELGGQSPVLTLIGRTLTAFDKVQASQWQLIGAGLNPIETAKWENTPLSLPDDTLLSQMIGVNAQGTVLGQRKSTTGDLELFYIDIDSAGRRHFNPPVYRDFPLSEYPHSEARSINATGDIAGFLIDLNGIKHSYVYRQNKGAGDLIPNTLSTDNDRASEALDLSDRNANGMIWVVGRTQIDANRWQAYVAIDNSMAAINTGLLNGDHSVAKSVNNVGEVVGQAQNSEGRNRAFLYHIDEDIFVDLNDHQNDIFNAGGSGIATDAIAINHRGNIVGTYTNNDKQYGYLLISTKKDPAFQLKEQAIKCLPTALDCLIDFSARVIAIDNGWMALGQYETNQVTLLQQGLDDTWFYHATLRPDDIAVNDQFGFSVDLHEKRLIVGANLDDSAGTSEILNVGAIYIYEYNNATATWDFDQKILPNPSQVVANLNFGHTVSVYDNRILVTTLRSSTIGFFYLKSASDWQEPIITDINSRRGRMGESFAVFSRNPIPIYPVTDNGLGTTPTLISQRNPFNEVESYGSTVAGTSGSSQSIYVYHHKNSRWHHQAHIYQPDSLGAFTLYANTLVRAVSKYTLYFYHRRHETWQLQARHTIKEPEFPPDTMTLNRDILAVSSDDSTQSIKIFSLTSPNRDGVDLTLTVDNPLGNIASNAGNLITFEAVVTNQDLEREAWNVHLQIDIANDQLIADKSDPRCLWLAQMAKVNCILGKIPAQTSIPVAITLQHQSPRLDFTTVQQGTDPQPSDNTVSIDTQYSNVDMTLTVTPSRNEISPNGIVDFTLNVQNDEPKPVAMLLAMSTDISVAYAGDSCDALESLCYQVGESTNLRYIVTVPSKQSSTFSVSLRFPSAGQHEITVNAPLFEKLPNPVTTAIQVGPNIPDIRILNHIKTYRLKENQTMPPLELTVRNWALENNDTGKHIDWILSQNSRVVKTGHIIEKSVNLGALELGRYTLQVTSVDNNHGDINEQDQINFTIQRPAPTVKILQPADNSTLRLSPGIGFDLQLAVENFPMKTGGKHYRWIWDGKETGVATALSLTLSPENFAEGPHQLMVELIDEDDTVLASSTITITIEHPNDVTVYWRNIPDTVLIEQTVPIELTIINNHQETPATDVRLSLSTTLIEWTKTTSLPPGCVLTTSTAILCQFPNFAANEQRDLNFAFTSQRGTATLSAAITQANPTDPVSPQLSKTINIIDPIDLSPESSWSTTDVRVNQTLQPTFKVTNLHPDRTATLLTLNGTLAPLLSPHQNFNLPSGCEIKDNTWQCTINTLAPGESRAFDWSFIAVGSGTINYQVIVSSNTQDDTNPNNDTHTTQITLTQPNPKITILQPSSTQTIYRHPLPSPADNTTYASSVQLHYRIDDWDQSERGIPHQVMINDGTPIERNAVSPLDITLNVIDGPNTIVIQLLNRDNKPIINPTTQMTLTVAEGTIVDVPEPQISTSGALGGWLLLGLGLWGWRRFLV